MKTSKHLTAFLLCLAFLIVLFYGFESRKQVNSLNTQLSDLSSKFGTQAKAYAELAENMAIADKMYWQKTEYLKAMIIQLQEDNKKLQEQLDRKIDLPESNASSKGNRGGERLIPCTVRASAYWEGSCGKNPDDPLYGITASGKYVKEGFVAAYLSEYPIGTKIYIPSLKDINGGWCTVMDCGGAIGRGELDIYMTSEAACFRFGVKELQVYILESSTKSS